MKATSAWLWRPLIPVVVLLPLGFLLGTVVDAGGVADSSAYLYSIVVLLVVGLYAATSSIDFREVLPDRWLVVVVVTVGVGLKAALIGGVLFLALDDPLFLVLGVVVAQVDPLSVAAVGSRSHVSERARRILVSWASFDDPVTSILAVYVVLVVYPTSASRPTTSQAVGDEALGLALSLAGNLALAASTYIAWRFLRSHSPWWGRLLLLAAGVVAVAQFYILAAALIGLFLRPNLGTLPRFAVSGAAMLAATLLGFLMSEGIDFRGVWLGLMAFLAHVAVAALLTWRLPSSDRVTLALAQQSGVTAIVLALLLESELPGVVALVGPAIVTTNAVYVIANFVAVRTMSARIEKADTSRSKARVTKAE